jgi:hypothetical protein
MEGSNGTGGAVEPPRRLVMAFVAALVAYFAAYYVVFAGRVAEYFSDLLKHFEFVRRLW